MSILTERQWSIERVNAWYDARPWIRGCNFMPSDCANRIDQWQKYDYEEHFATADRELAAAHEIGFNSVRVIMDYYVCKDEHDSYMENLERFLTLCAKYEITALIVFANDCVVPKELYVRPQMGKQEVYWGYHGNRIKSPQCVYSNIGWSILDDPELKEDFYQMVREIMTKYANDERIIAWNMFNEPGNCGRETISVPHVRELFTIGREIDPIQPLTSDIMRTPARLCEAEKESLKYCDIISSHNYMGYEAQILEIAELKKIGRPLFCTEYLHRVGCDDIKLDFPLFYLERVACYNWGFVAGKNQTYEPWGVYWQWEDDGKDHDLDFTKWQHDLLRPNLRPYDPKEIRLITKFCQRADADWAEKQEKNNNN